MARSRWNRAYPDIQVAWQHLADFLGDSFDPALTDFDHLRQFLDQEWRRLRPHFYEQSIGYLYDLTFFHFMDAKTGFFETFLDFAEEYGLTRIADIGCGIALDTQALLQAGYDVDAYDLNNPSLTYAHWRLGRATGEPHRVRRMSQLEWQHYQIVYAADVLGHAKEPENLVESLFASADYVVINLLPHDANHRFGIADLHPRLDHGRILPVLHAHGELIRLGSSGNSVTTIWRAWDMKQ